MIQDKQPQLLELILDSMPSQRYVNLPMNLPNDN
eukprot:CAMPEP_0194418528 /NCGR_PEP_ID=MMETSP0176-20130528/17672_1 /TAXON_ID=216777 /ORGANISM="Proboscia alata, Strain PI-D3" /LENGTH=33 /DNA_ID= /DNA_START= /DNA_END= /DNA_ORIENTATION=